MCEHGDRRVTRMENNGTKTPLATHFNVRRARERSQHDFTYVVYICCGRSLLGLVVVVVVVARCGGLGCGRW